MSFKFFIPNGKLLRQSIVPQFNFLDTLEYLNIEYTVTNRPESDSILLIVPLNEIQIRGNDHWVEGIKKYFTDHSWSGPVLIWYPEEQFDWISGGHILNEIVKKLGYPKHNVFYVSGDKTPVESANLASDNVLYFPYFAYRISRLTAPTSKQLKSAQKSFICPIWHARPARQYLLHYLYKNNFLDKGYVSFGRNKYSTLEVLKQYSSKYLPASELEQIAETMTLFLPLEENNFTPQYQLTIDDSGMSQDKAWSHQWLLDQLYPYMRSTKVYISPESGWNWQGDLPHPTGFLTEKTFFAVLSRMPFLIHGEKHLIKTMQDLGYETFSDHVDESYDEHDSIHQRTLAMLDSLNQFCDISDISVFDDIVEHNYNVLLTSDYKSMLTTQLEKIQP